MGTVSLHTTTSDDNTLDDGVCMKAGLIMHTCMRSMANQLCGINYWRQPTHGLITVCRYFGLKLLVGKLMAFALRWDSSV
jgi:hypothetical protein